MINDELESELSRVRQALANSVAVEIQIKQQIQKNSEAVQNWEKRVGMARAAGQEELALQAEEKIKKCQAAANELEIQLLSQQDFIANQKKELSKLESRRFSTGGSGGKAVAAADATLSTIQRMENKIVAHESMAEVTGDGVERKFVDDKAANELEDELKALKAAIKKE